jgi:ribosomal protein L35AE/L33A
MWSRASIGGGTRDPTTSLACGVRCFGPPLCPSPTLPHTECPIRATRWSAWVILVSHVITNFVDHDLTELGHLMRSSSPAVRCKAVSKSSRKQCRNRAIKGGEVCRIHGGAAPAVKAKAVVRAVLLDWRVGDALDDPGEVLLRLVTQSRKRADLYAHLLQEAFDAAERLKQAYGAGAARR